MNSIFNDPAKAVMATWIAVQFLSAAVQSLPSPSEVGNKGVWYKAFYNFCSVVVTDIKSFIKTPPGFSAQRIEVQSQQIVEPGARISAGASPASTINTISTTTSVKEGA